MAEKSSNHGGFAARGHRTKPRNRRQIQPDSAKNSPFAAISDRPPRDLGADGRRAWRAAVESAPWLDGGADHLLLHRFCALHDELAELQHLIATEGRLTAGSKGQMTESPAVRMVVSVDDRIVKLAAALGLGPAARKRVHGRLEVERERPNLAPVLDLYHEAVGE